MAPAKSSSKKGTSSSSADKENGSAKVSKTKAPVIKELIIRPSDDKTYLQSYTNYPNVQITEATLQGLELTKGSFVKVSIGLKDLVMLVDVTDNIDDDVVLINQYYLDLY
jgi:hypothetical protein